MIISSCVAVASKIGFYFFFNSIAGDSNLLANSESKFDDIHLKKFFDGIECEKRYNVETISEIEKVILNHINSNKLYFVQVLKSDAIRNQKILSFLEVYNESCLHIEKIEKLRSILENKVSFVINKKPNGQYLVGRGFYYANNCKIRVSLNYGSFEKLSKQTGKEIKSINDIPDEKLTDFRNSFQKDMIVRYNSEYPSSPIPVIF